MRSGFRNTFTEGHFFAAQGVSIILFAHDWIRVHAQFENTDLGIKK